MLSRTLGVALIVVLGVVWFVLEEQSRGRLDGETVSPLEVVAKTERSDLPVQSLRRDDPVSEGAGERPASMPAARDATELPAPPPALEPDAVAVFVEAARLQAAGDVQAAVAALREAVAQARTPFEAGRAALQLAPLSDDPLERRVLYSQALAAGAVRGGEFEEVGLRLRTLNRDPRASLHPLLTVERYEVAAGDSLWKLANKTLPATLDIHTEVGLIKLVNGMQTDQLSVGQELVAARETLRIEVRRSQHGLIVWLGEAAVASYRVGLGKEDRTPQGRFVVEVKQEQPAWYHNGRTIPFGDPENVLGTRWMGFDKQPGASGYGIHGTADPDSIGRNESMGCIRMRNAEVEELFEVVRRGTEVLIG